MAVSSIAQTLGAGSGIDLSALVSGLVDAQFATKTQQLKQRSDALTAQISGVAKLRSAVTGLDAALAALVGGGSLASTLSSSDPAAVRATAAAGAGVPQLSASVGVMQLASAQVASTDAPVARAAPWRTGTLTLRMGRDVTDAGGAVTGFAAAGEPLEITIGPEDATLDGIAARINAATSTVRASVVTDGEGVRLVLRGQSGAAQAFELSAADTGDEGLSLAGLAVGGGGTGMTSGARARDAILQVDGVRYVRPTNSVEGVVPGVTLDLLAVTAAPATLSAAKPVSALSAAVTDFAGAYNEVLGAIREQLDPVSGALRGDPAAGAMARSLRALTTAVLAPEGEAGAPRTLADLGVATARDGTLSVDARRLAAALAAHPQAVEAMIAGAGGLGAALGRVAAQATDRTYGLDAATVRYTREAGRIAAAQDKLTETAETTRTRLTRQFASMDSRVAAYKSTQTFLTGQIAAWNRRND